MKNQDARKLKVLWRPRKVYAWVIFVSVLGILVAIQGMSYFSTIAIDRKDVWRWSVTIAILIFLAFVICVCFLIRLRAKRKKAYVYYEINIIVKGKEKLYYAYVYLRHTTILQRIFGLVTIEFISISESRKIILKDVSKKILNYLDNVIELSK